VALILVGFQTDRQEQSVAKPKQIRPVSASKCICWLNYGYPGCGKTCLIGTGGKGQLLVRPPTDHPDAILGSGVEEWVVEDWSQMEEIHDYLRHDGQEWDWVHLDSISLFQDHGLDDIWEETLDRRPDRKGQNPDKPEYGKNMVRLARWIRNMNGMAQAGMFNFGVTAHPMELWDADSDSEKLKPWIQGKQMSDKICGYMNVISYMEIKQRKRVLRFEATEDYIAKDQFNAFKNHRLINPTMPKFMRAINTAREGKQTRTKKAQRRKSRGKK
jgi:hypothetical protein